MKKNLRQGFVWGILQSMVLVDLLLLASLAAPVVVLNGCASQKIHPGSPNKYDSGFYDALLVGHGVIEQTKSDLASGAFSVTIVPTVKSALNYLITAYDAMDNAFLAYHSASIAGTSKPAQLDAVNAAQSTMNSALTQLSN